MKNLKLHLKKCIVLKLGHLEAIHFPTEFFLCLVG